MPCTFVSQYSGRVKWSYVTPWFWTQNLYLLAREEAPHSPLDPARSCSIPDLENKAFSQVTAGSIGHGEKMGGAGANWQREGGDSRQLYSRALGHSMASPSHPYLPLLKSHCICWSVGQWISDESFKKEVLVQTRAMLLFISVYGIGSPWQMVSPKSWSQKLLKQICGGWERAERPSL